MRSTSWRISGAGSSPCVRRRRTAYVGWRLLATDPEGVGFNLYRSAGTETPVRLNASVLTTTTDFVDTTLDPALSNTLHGTRGGERQGADRQRAVRAAGQHRRFGSSLPCRCSGQPVARRPGPLARWRAYTYSAKRRERRRSRRRRRVRDRAEVGSVELARHAVARRLGPRDARRVQVGRDAALADRSRPEHQGRRSLHAVHRLRPRRRRSRGSRVQDGGRHGRRARQRSSATRRRTIASLLEPTDGAPVASATDSRFGKVLAGPEYFTVFDGLTGAALATSRLHPRPRAAGRLGRHRRQRRHRQRRQPRRSISRRRRVPRRPSAERADGARLLRPLGDRRLGLAAAAS